MQVIRTTLVAVSVSTLLSACVASGESDTAHLPVFLSAPYSSLPPGGPIEKGRPVALDPLQQEVVVRGVAKWMKEPRSIAFGPMEAARNDLGFIVVCGEVDGRNSAGRYVGPSPFIGVLMGKLKSPDFVVVGLGSSDGERTEVLTLCRESGVQIHRVTAASSGGR